MRIGKVRRRGFCTSVRLCGSFGSSCTTQESETVTAGCYDGGKAMSISTSGVEGMSHTRT